MTVTRLGLIRSQITCPVTRLAAIRLVHPSISSVLTISTRLMFLNHTKIDLLAHHSEWCGNSTFQRSYAGKTGDFAGYNVVAYFSEFGCNDPSPRIWTEVSALFSSQMSDVWSGGLAFSYFPAESSQGEFGMVTISADGSTVQTSTDFDNLKTQYGQVSPPNTPSKSNAGSGTYPNCFSQNSTFLASNTLPPTPSNSACQCLENNLSCQFNPQTTNTSAIIGTLLDTACSLIGTKGGNCDAIASNGQTGQYGVVSECDPCTLSCHRASITRY